MFSIRRSVVLRVPLIPLDFDSFYLDDPQRAIVLAWVVIALMVVLLIVVIFY